MTGKTTGSGSTSRALVATALAVLAGLAAVYVTLGRPDNARAPTVAGPAVPQAGKLNVGEMAAFVFKREPEPVENVAFVDGDGRQRTLKDWEGRVVLLNLWATWCAPCRKEMPDLARLQKELGSPRFEVVALAVDRAGKEAIARFLSSIDAAALALYIDPTARAGTALKAAGMPTTLLIDAQGREVGRLTGAAEWYSEDAKRLVRAHIR